MHPPDPHSDSPDSISAKHNEEIADLEQQNQRLQAQIAQLKQENAQFRARAVPAQVLEASANVALRQTLALLANETDLDRFVGHVLKVIADQLNAPVTEYWHHPQPRSIAYLARSCWKGQILTADDLADDCRVQGVAIPPEMIGYENLHDRQQHFVVEDLVNDPIQSATFAKLDFDMEAWCLKHKVQKEINFPLRLGNSTIGALCVYIPGDRTFTESQIELGYALAQQVTLAIRLTQMAEEAKQAAIAREQEQAAQARSAELEKINEVLQRTIVQLATNPNLDAYLGQVMIETATQIGADNTALFLYEAANNTLSMHLFTLAGTVLDMQSDPRLEIWREPVPADVTSFWNSVSTQPGYVIHVDDAANSEFWAPSIEWHVQMGHKSVMCVPLRIDDRAIGFIGYGFCDRTEIAAEKIALSQALADQATLALELTRLAEEAKQAAVAKLSEALAREQEQAAQQRAAELVKANHALKQSLDVLATNPDLKHFIGQVLSAIADQFGSPLTEYWSHPMTGDTVYIQMMAFEGQIYNRAEIERRFPDHPGVRGFEVPPEMIHNEVLQQRKKQYIVEDWYQEPHIQQIKRVDWYPLSALYKEINTPMVLGDRAIGALVVRLPRNTPISIQQVELAQALAHQATLAIELTRLSQQAQESAVLEERNRLARDIHDTIAQGLAGIIIQLQAAEDPQTPSDDRTTHLQTARELAKTSLTEARRSVQALRPPALDNSDLPNALTQLVQQTIANAGITAQCDIPQVSYSLPAAVETHLLRIAQEALTNVLKHAQADRVTVELAYDLTQVRLCICDNGCGFQPESVTRGFGLTSLQERSQLMQAQLTITSRSAIGTTILVTVPLSTMEAQ